VSRSSTPSTTTQALSSSPQVSEREYINGSSDAASTVSSSRLDRLSYNNDGDNYASAASHSMHSGLPSQYNYLEDSPIYSWAPLRYSQDHHRPAPMEPALYTTRTNARSTDPSSYALNYTNRSASFAETASTHFHVRQQGPIGNQTVSEEFSGSSRDWPGLLSPPCPTNPVFHRDSLSSATSPAVTDASASSYFPTPTSHPPLPASCHQPPRSMPSSHLPIETKYGHQASLPQQEPTSLQVGTRRVDNKQEREHRGFSKRSNHVSRPC